MPDFDKLHEEAKRLADLTSSEGRQPGLLSWGEMVAGHWKAIAEMWDDPAPPKLAFDADPTTGACYVSAKDSPERKVRRTVPTMGKRINLDYDDEGRLIGVEILL